MADSKLKTWFKRIGLIGFFFFLVKGLLWLAAAVVAALSLR